MYSRAKPASAGFQQPIQQGNRVDGQTTHPGEGPLPAEKHRDIPSLDGLRVFSIVPVILGHSKWFLPRLLVNSSVYRFTIGNSKSGGYCVL
jgi:hypothetical protein